MKPPRAHPTHNQHEIRLEPAWCASGGDLTKAYKFLFKTQPQPVFFLDWFEKPKPFLSPLDDSSHFSNAFLIFLSAVIGADYAAGPCETSRVAETNMEFPSMVKGFLALLRSGIKERLRLSDHAYHGLYSVLA
jgi:hypothetical protein